MTTILVKSETSAENLLSRQCAAAIMKFSLIRAPVQMIGSAKADSDFSVSDFDSAGEFFGISKF